MANRDRSALEAQLREASDRIGERIGAIENEVRLPRLAGLSGVGSNGRLARVGIALATGLALGWVLGGFGRKGRKKKRTGSRWADRVVDDAVRLADDGHELPEAVRRAVREHAADLPDASSGGGILSVVVGYALKSGINALVKEFVGRAAGNGTSEPDGDGSGLAA